MKVLLTDDVHPVMVERLHAAGIECHIDTHCDRERLIEAMNGYDAIVVRSKISVDRALIDQAKTLRCIARVGAGMETIDVDYAESRGIKCINSPEGNRDAVGEHAVGMLLALMDRIVVADREVRCGIWHREANRGMELNCQTVGLIGFGNMGSSFAEKLRGFGCRIIAYDKYKPVGYAPDYVEEVSLEYLQQYSDIVSLHVPLTDETRGMVCSSFIAAFEHPVILINTSRGAVVRTPDLVKAMREGRVTGVALDVIEYENMAVDGLAMSNLPDEFQYLAQSPNTVLTPHVAGWTIESRYKLAAVLADKIIEALC